MLVSRSIIKAPLFIRGESISWRGLKQTGSIGCYILIVILNAWIFVEGPEWWNYIISIPVIIINLAFIAGHIYEGLDCIQSKASRLNSPMIS